MNYNLNFVAFLSWIIIITKENWHFYYLIAYLLTTNKIGNVIKKFDK